MSGTTTSAAAVGVGARRSATKSIRVVSVSCPTAEINGKLFHLDKYDATIVPPLVPHCFHNHSHDLMVIAYFYPEVDVRRDPVERALVGCLISSTRRVV